jgi:hypothetical protein
MNTLPDILDCRVCRCLLPIAKFRKDKGGATYKHLGRYSVSEICWQCQQGYLRHRLSPAQRRRYEDIRSETRRPEVDGHRRQGRMPPRRGEHKAPKAPKGPAPYDLAVAQLEAEWGKPVKDWTLRDDYRCTERIYRILGWPVEDLAKDSRAARDAKDNRMRERKIATATATADEDDPDA